jgi:5'-3' exonuclease
VVDYCIGNDMDLLAFGCPSVIRNINFSDDNVDIYTTDAIINALDLTKAQFIDLCIILGCDYTDRLIGIKNAFGLALIKQYGSIEKIINSMEEINIEHRRQYLEKYPGVTEPPYCIKVGEDFNYQKARSLFNIAFNPEFITSLISPTAFDNIAETCRKIRMNPNRYSEVIEFCVSHCIGLNKQLITRKLGVILNIEWINDKSDDSYMEGKFEKVSKRKFNLLGNQRSESVDRSINATSLPIACQRKPGFTRVEFGSSPGHSASIAWC